jgi:hypothetical protein
MLIADRPGISRQVALGSGAEHLPELAESREDIHQPKPRNGASDEVVGEHGTERRNSFRKIIAIPEGGPRDHDEQKARFQ